MVNWAAFFCAPLVLLAVLVLTRLNQPAQLTKEGHSLFDKNAAPESRLALSTDGNDCPAPRSGKKIRVPSGNAEVKPVSNYGFVAALPLEYRGAEIIAAEELLYENGTTEVHWVLDVGLGQEKILLVEKFAHNASYRHSAFFSAERLSAFVEKNYLDYIKAALRSAGFEVLENKYGATVLSLRFMGPPAEFLSAKILAEQILDHRGDLFLSPPRATLDGV